MRLIPRASREITSLLPALQMPLCPWRKYAEVEVLQEVFSIAGEGTILFLVIESR